MNAIQLALCLVFAVPLTSPPIAPQDAQAKSSKSFPQEQLEQLVAPIALYPDALLTQVLMAATYPLEIVQAARWLDAHPGLEGDELDQALAEETWDPSVKSLCGLPDVLKRMNENLDWTRDLGDAFLGQQAELMDAVQHLRQKAKEAGNLESSDEQKVTEQDDQIIVIQSASPEVIYVPTYYPSAVYGGWGYPTWYYPPLYVPPPPGHLFFGFAVGVTWGWAMWGGCHWGWGHTEVNINVNRYNTFVDRTEVPARREELRREAGADGRWQHQPEHRQGVGYRDREVAGRYDTGRDRATVTSDRARGYGDRTATSWDDSQPRTAEGRSSPERSSRDSGGTFSGARDPRFDRAGSERGRASRGSAVGSRAGGGFRRR